MDRKEFGKLIVALRREHLDNHLKPWTREKFAQEAGIDVLILANIENGKKAMLSADLLIKLANALKLTSGERKELFLATSGVNEKDIYQPHDSPKAALEDMLSFINQVQLPAFIVDQYFDIVAVNLMVLEVYNIDLNVFLNPASNPATRFNLVRMLFSSEFDEQKEMFGDVWTKFAANTTMLFRAASFQYRATEYFQSLYPQLCEFDDFKNYIQRQRKFKDDHFVDNNIFIMIDNPKYGKIRSISTSVRVTTIAGELTLFTFTPLSEETSKIYLEIAKNNYVFPVLPDWPDKSVLFE
jgi:transcriptional regulator with XRE-family HTH domain